jgi:2,4-dienoyl-CoA reductase (NADPH2)
MIFDPITINGVTFKNRVLRSAMGGRMANYDGTVTSVWKNFERLFAEGGAGGIVSTTFSVNSFRQAPFEYPSISQDRFVAPVRRYLDKIRENTPYECKYIIQIGDPGYVTQSSLFPERADTLSSSSGFDLVYGYGSRRAEMTEREIEQAIQDFVVAAGRVRETGADGLELTASKGYLVHQFLNPGMNRRRDQWGSGGPTPKRFLFLKSIVEGIRKRIGHDFLFGVKLSAQDINYLPYFALRLPIAWPLTHHYLGNTEAETLQFAKELDELGVDYLHLVSGCGFISPRDTPGPFPLDEVRIYFDSTRHLSRKAALRAGVANLFAHRLLRRAAQWGWERELPPGGSSVGWRSAGANLEAAGRFRQQLKMKIVVNGGLKRQDLIENALQDGKCDMVSIGRGLLANPDLVRQFRDGINEPQNSCTYCNRCAARTATSPLGCYNLARFPDLAAMQEQIMAMNRSD